MSDMMAELLKEVLDPEGSMKHGERNTVGRDKVNGIIVSTVNTRDLGPETAILDRNGTHPVQRYVDLVEAKQGHKEWVEKAKHIITFTELGYPGVTDDKEITLVK